MARPIVFLPGMSGDGSFWSPVAEELSDHEHVLVDWPGLGTTPADPAVSSYDDLTELVLGRLHEPSVVVAQSMGGYVAVRVASQAPEMVTHLVLAATSGGLDLRRFGALDWRPGSRQSHPGAPDWAFAETGDVSELIRAISVPALLIWATRDAISPLAVGEHLAGLIAGSRLVSFDSDDHWVARVHATEVAKEIAELIGGSGST